ncbi:MAG: hypothetical protein ACJ718_06465 [Nitrososphaeraceae archaeon]
MPLNNNNRLLKFTLIGLSLSLSGLFACMFFSSNNTAFAQQQRQLEQQLQTLNPSQNITTTNATNTLSLIGTATTTVKPESNGIVRGRNNQQDSKHGISWKFKNNEPSN